MLPSDNDNADEERVMLAIGLLVTVTTHESFTPLPSAAVAVIVAVPTDFAVTRPASEIEATVALLVDHITDSVASEGVTVAVS